MEAANPIARHPAARNRDFISRYFTPGASRFPPTPPPGPRVAEAAARRMAHNSLRDDGRVYFRLAGDARPGEPARGQRQGVSRDPAAADGHARPARPRQTAPLAARAAAGRRRAALPALLPAVSPERGRPRASPPAARRGFTRRARRQRRRLRGRLAQHAGGAGTAQATRTGPG